MNVNGNQRKRGAGRHGRRKRLATNRLPAKP
jgi:hypothetical protein